MFKILLFMMFISAIGGSLRSCSHASLSLPKIHKANVAKKEKPIVVGFFNGVMTTRGEARDEMIFLSRQKFSDKPVQYELFYNQTDGLAADMLEVFQQRLAEQPAILQNRFELYWDMVGGRSSMLSDTLEAEPSLITLIAAVDKSILAYEAVYFADRAIGGKKANTIQVYGEQKTKADSLLASGNRLVFIAHSQGNLFANKLYDTFSTKTKKETKVVHVAPASQTLRGEHILADKDEVINGLRPSGNVATNTIDIPAYEDRPPGINGKTDPRGHGFLEIYLNPRLKTLDQMSEEINRAMHP